MDTIQKVKGKTFAQWMAQVTLETQRMVGLHAEDLTDISYGDLWEDGTTPKSAARKAIKASGGEGSF